MEEEKRKRSLKYSVIDGAFFSVMVGFGESFFSAFAVFFNANNIQLGLLGSLPQTLGFLAQLISRRLLKLFRSRKRLVYMTAFMQGLMYIPIALVYYFGTLRVAHLIIFISIYWILGNLGSPAWNSWMGDLVGEKERGSYFGNRNRISGLASFISLLIAGYALQRISSHSVYGGFVVIFLVAFVARTISAVFLTLKDEPPYLPEEEEKTKFIDFIRTAGTTNFGLFVIYVALINFSVYIASPFFTPYMLRDLNFDYTVFTIVSAASVMMKFLMMPVWGALIDRYGTKKALAATGYLMPFVSLMWLFSADVWYLIIIQIYSGFVWAGFEMATFNYLYDSTTHKNRATFAAFYNVTNGIMIFIGAMIGGYIVRHNTLFWSKYMLVFLVSAAFRLVFSFALLSKINEMRNVEQISKRQLIFKAISSMPTMGIVHDIVMLGKKRKE